MFLVRWNASADSCSFLFLSLFLCFFVSLCLFCIWPIYIYLFPFTCNFMWFIKLRASAGISGYVWGVCICAWVCAGVHGCVWVCAGVHRCAQVCTGVRGYARVWTGMHGYVWVCAGVRRRVRVCTGVRWCVRRYAWVYTCVWDEFSEFLLENRVPTSADFNTYPIRIF